MKLIYLIPIIFLGACVTTRPVDIPKASTARIQQNLADLDKKLAEAGQTNAKVSQHLQNARDAANELLKQLDELDLATPSKTP